MIFHIWRRTRDVSVSPQGFGMKAVIEHPNSWVLSKDSPLRRLPSRPARYRQRGFDRLFDSRTIFYDCVYVRNAGMVMLQGPPFLNLTRQIESLSISAPPDGRNLRYLIREGDRHAQLWVSTAEPIPSLCIGGELGETKLAVSADRNEFFRDRRVLVSTNKNNKLDWICDWIRFHRDVHGANAVLLYDNSSTVYDLNDLVSRLQTTSVDRIAVVSWPFQYGPGGYAGFWDSDFCQYGALENARWRYLQEARSVLSCDIDELVVTRGESVFELAESSGYVTFDGRWIVGIESGADRDRAVGQGSRHADFCHALRVRIERRDGRLIDHRCPPKWAVVPSRCPCTSQWMVHTVRGLASGQSTHSSVAYRHFREINTNWKYDRSRREIFDSERHYVDEDLRAAFEEVRWSQ
jgi:hypothetical protein